MDIVKIFARAQSPRIEFPGIYYQTKLTFSEIWKQEAGTELKNYIFRMLQYKNTITRLYTLPLVKTEDILLIKLFIVETLASMVQIYRFLFKSIQITFCKNKSTLLLVT